MSSASLLDGDTVVDVFIEIQRLCLTAAPGEDLRVKSCSFNAEHVQDQRTAKWLRL